MHNQTSQNPRWRTSNEEDPTRRYTPEYEDFEILPSSSRSQDFLMTLEALWIRELDPQINTKDEYKTKELTIKL